MAAISLRCSSLSSAMQILGADGADDHGVGSAFSLGWSVPARPKSPWVRTLSATACGSFIALTTSSG